MGIDGVNKTTKKHQIDNSVDAGPVTAKIKAPGPKVETALLFNKIPDSIRMLYGFELATNKKALTINPRRPVMRGLVGARRGGFTSENSAAGGKIIHLQDGPFKHGEWRTGALKDLITSRGELAKVRAAGYDVNDKVSYLVVNADPGKGRRDNHPIAFFFSPDAQNHGLVAVCSEVTILPFNGQGGGPVMIRKPVIYVYPERKMIVRVALQVQGEVVAEYPKMTDGAWQMVATPEGTLFDPTTERRFSYLFWEATRPQGFAIDPAQAHLVTDKNAETFLEKACVAYGLNDKEKTDFVSYWLPHLEKNDMSLVQFLATDEYARYADLQVSPKPDTLIRMFMIFKRTATAVQTGNPALPKGIRKGYTVVEWGGTNLDERV
ncbi:MAG: hypothetical protein HY903_01890 [Deltaproteobacteria bacterium]|nr:hypothetical protein [Deltaproteobacteria bacterium]